MFNKSKHKAYKRVYCSDGYNVSVQAGDGKYCQPCDDNGPYTEVELGFPSVSDPMLDGYAEDRETPTETVYAYVPVNVVRDLIVRHGGAVSGEVPAGVVMLMAPIKRRKQSHDKR
tara:strand:- start:2 stop:346 length:345 start_codon:yes stop_codon:yes gene_type:complete